MSFGYQITPSAITLSSHTAYAVIPTSDPRYNNVLTRIKRGDKFTADEIAALGKPENCVMDWGKGYLTENEDGVLHISVNGETHPVSRHLANVLMEFVRGNLPVEALANFIVRMMRNPSMRSRNLFYDFARRYGITITPEGKVRGYKAVTGDWLDKHTGTVDNRVGVTVPELPRSEVSDDPDLTCSFGYHFGSIEYVRGFANVGDHIIVVEVDPADIVCVPRDCSQQKVRCTQYTVVGEYTGILPAYVDDDEETSDDDDWLSWDDEDCDWESDEDEYVDEDDEDDEDEDEDEAFEIAGPVTEVRDSFSHSRTLRFANGSSIRVSDEDGDDGISYCHMCGSQVKAGANFCSACGEPQ